MDVTLTDTTAGVVVATIATLTDGTYIFEQLDCSHAYEVTYTNTTPYIADSSQHNQTEQQATSTQISVDSNDFRVAPISLSPDNNF